MPTLERIFELILAETKLACNLEIYFHRGRGHLPKNLAASPNPRASSLLQVFPAKLRAYAAATEPEEVLLVVVLDSDDSDVDVLYGRLVECYRRFAPRHVYCIGIAVEEFEAWLLGDIEALSRAYPDYNKEAYASYEQDAIVGTWEILAKVVHAAGADRLIRNAYPAVGAYKMRWAENISPFLELDSNRSESFKRFIQHIRRSLVFWTERIEAAGEVPGNFPSEEEGES